MSSLFLDPYIFACPVDGSERELTDYLTNILNWHQLKELRWPKIITTAETHNILEKEKSYPPYPVVRDAIDRRNIIDIDAHDIGTLINALLANGLTIEDVTGVLETEFDSFSLLPVDVMDDRTGGYQAHLASLLVAIGIYNSFQMGKNHLLTRTSQDSAIELSVEGRVTEVLALEAERYSCPIPIGYDILVHNRYDCLLGHIDAVNAWLTASSEEEYQASLYLAAYQHMCNARVHERAHTLTQWTFGKEFLNSAREAGAMTRYPMAEFLLRACSEVALGLNLGKSHALRETHHAKSKQRLRNTDKAWRRDIDYEYHLHYWETEVGPEFGHVGVHNDFRLPT